MMSGGAQLYIAICWFTYVKTWGGGKGGKGISSSIT